MTSAVIHKLEYYSKVNINLMLGLDLTTDNHESQLDTLFGNCECLYKL